MSASSLSTQNAPSPWLVVPFYVWGSLFFITASMLMSLYADQIFISFVGPKILTITHLFVLGWVSMIIFGALYQLIPVVMEVKLYSEKPAFFSMVMLVIGTIMLSASFWNSYIAGTYLKHIGGVFVILAALSVVFNVLMTSRNTANKTIENLFIIVSSVWLLFTVLFGLFIILNLNWGWVHKSNVDLLKIHVIVGLLGWFMTLVMGVASTLLPMFFIAHQLNKSWIRKALILSNIGLSGLVIGLWFDSCHLITVASALVWVFGFSFFLRYNFEAYKKRLRKKLDIGMKLTVWAFVSLLLFFVFGLMSLFASKCCPSMVSPLYINFVLFLILGFFTILILGQMYKTLPFIVWLWRYQGKVGKYKIPLPSDLYSEKVANAHFYTAISGLAILSAGILTGLSLVLYLGSGLITLTSLLYGYNTLKIVLHRDHSQPLQTNKN